MNLEAVEQRCLSYLMNTNKLMTPVSELLQMLDQDDECQGMDVDKLLRFLGEHELFSVFEPIGLQFGLSREELGKYGLVSEPSVILTTRMPTQVQMVASMASALGTMMNAMEAALRQAEEDNDQKRVRNTQAILGRARALQEKLQEAGIRVPRNAGSED